MEIRSSISQGFDFVKKNPTIIYSLLLIIAVTSVIIFNSYYSLDKFQKNTDSLLQSKAVLAEDIVNVLLSEFIDNIHLTQEKIKAIKDKDSEIKEISILVPENDLDGFRIDASTKEDEIGSVIGEQINFIAWREDDGVAFLDSDSQERFWTVSKAIKKGGEKIGLISIKMSLDQHDLFVKETIKRVYFISLVSVLIVLMLIANHARMFKYAVRVSKLEEIDRMKDDFISMASHELVSPLTAIRGYGELLAGSIKEKNIQDERVFIYLRNIDTSATRLVELVDDMLEVSRIEQNRLPINIESLDIFDIIAKVAEEMRVNAEKKNLELTYEKKEISKVMADPARVKQILVNLLSNAVKYTPKGKVEIMTKEDSKYVFVTVADSGLGISANDLKNLFSKFYRIQNEDTKNISGTGLGMWISRELARKMEGDLEVESIAGVGSHFTLKLRKA